MDTCCIVSPAGLYSILRLRFASLKNEDTGLPVPFVDRIISDSLNPLFNSSSYILDVSDSPINGTLS